MLGAGGGVGLAAVQLAVALGATVTAVASSAEKLEAAAAMGATHLVNHRDGDLRAALKATLPGGADVVIDPVGGTLSEPALRALRYGGRFVVVGFAAGEIPRIPLNLVLLKGCRIMGFEFRSFMTHETDAMIAGRGRAARAARGGPGVAAHRRDVPARRDRGGAALRGRRQRDRQGRPHRQVTQTVRSSVKVSVSWPKSSSCWSRRV